MNPTEALKVMRAAGFTIYREGENLCVTPKLDERRRVWVKAHKPALLAALRAEESTREETIPRPAADFAALAEDLEEFYEERAGILEYEAGLTRPEAEQAAARLTAVRYKLHNGEGGGSVIARNATAEELLADLRARYGARLAETHVYQEGNHSAE